MVSALRVIGRSLAAWYRDLLTVTGFNVMWVAMLLLVIPAAPATAALYSVCARVADHELVDWRDYLTEIRRLFVPAWIWAIPQILIYGIGLFNLQYYAFQSGAIWELLRWIWVIVLIVWGAVQFFYWPLYFEEEDKSFRNTLRNSLVLISANPIFAFVILVISAILIFASMLITAPVGLALAGWIALIGTFAVRDRLGKIPTH